MDLNRKHAKEYNLKVIVIGDSGVGKSTLVTCITNGYPTCNTATHRIAKSSKTVSIDDHLVKLHIHDTAGMID